MSENHQLTELDEDEVGLSDAGIAVVAGYSAIAGLCPLIPVPFVDDLIIDRVHRRLCQKLCEQHNFYLASDGAKVLTSSPSNLLSGAFMTVLLWPIKKILRKLVYFLAIKSCADVAAGLFNEGWLLGRALEQGYVPLEALARGDAETLQRLRDAIVQARDHVDAQPTLQVMNSAFGVGREVFGPMLDAMKGVLSSSDEAEAKLDAAEEQAAPIARRIEDEIRKHWSNGPALDAALRRALARPADDPRPTDGG